MLNIAVTGGIGAGKSTLTDYLLKLGYTVIDADKMSREMTSAGGKAMPYILEHFGPDFILLNCAWSCRLALYIRCHFDGHSMRVSYIRFAF